MQIFYYTSVTSLTQILNTKNNTVLDVLTEIGISEEVMKTGYIEIWNKIDL